MTQFFLAYEASNSTIKHKGYRVFTSDAETPEEIGELLEGKLTDIQNSLGFGLQIVATAFNKV